MGPRRKDSLVDTNQPQLTHFGEAIGIVNSERRRQSQSKSNQLEPIRIKEVIREPVKESPEIPVSDQFLIEEGFPDLVKARRLLRIFGRDENGRRK